MTDIVENLDTIIPSLTSAVFNYRLSSQAYEQLPELSMPLIALSPTNPAGYFIGIDGKWRWNHIPDALVKDLLGANDRNEKLVKLSLGPDGDYWLRTNKNHYCLTDTAPGITSNVENFLTHYKNTGVEISKYNIEHFVFMPNPAEFLGIITSAELQRQQAAWSQQADSLLVGHLQTTMPSATLWIKCIAFGKNGGWVVIHGDGTLNYYNVPAGLEEKIKQSKPGSIAQVALSLADETHWAIEYADSSIAYNLHPEVAAVFMEKWKEEQELKKALNNYMMSQSLLTSQAISGLQGVYDHSIWAPVAASAAASAVIANASTR